MFLRLWGKGSDSIVYTSQNGYTGILYGKSSISIQNESGREVFHSGRRTANTLEELQIQVDEFPEFIKMLMSHDFNYPDKEET